MAQRLLLILTVLIPAISANFPLFYSYEGALAGDQLVAAPIPEITSPDNAVPLICLQEGFYRHPTNCSRFYRCVDYSGVGQVFSRYEFECPRHHVFLTVGKNTCVPGDCSTLANVGFGPSPVVMPQPAPVSSVASSQTGASESAPVVPVSSGSQSAVGPSVAPVVPVADYPQPSVGVQTVPIQPMVPTTGQGSSSSGSSTSGNQGTGTQVGGGVYPSPGAGSVSTGGYQPSAGSSQGAGSQGAATGDGCAAKYVQDDKYCNIYQPCPADGNKYVCTTGSVFDQANQMCRLNSRADDVCGTKEMYPTSFLRTDILDPTIGITSPVVQQPIIGNPQPIFGNQHSFIGNQPQFKIQSVSSNPFQFFNQQPQFYSQPFGQPHFFSQQQQPLVARQSRINLDQPQSFSQQLRTSRRVR